MQGIYMIRNIKNDKKYIGSSKNIEERWQQHQSALKNNGHTNKLQYAYNKYGEDSFEYVVLEEVDSSNLLLIKEKEWIDKYNSVFDGYNSVEISEGVTEKKILLEEKRVKALIYNRLFWSIYDDERIHISRIWLDRLKDPEYYEYTTLKRICIILNFAYENAMEGTVSCLRIKNNLFRIEITQRNGTNAEYFFKTINHKYIPYMKYVMGKPHYEYKYDNEELSDFRKTVYQYEIQDILTLLEEPKEDQQ